MPAATPNTHASRSSFSSYAPRFSRVAVANPATTTPSPPLTNDSEMVRSKSKPSGMPIMLESTSHTVIGTCTSLQSCATMMAATVIETSTATGAAVSTGRARARSGTAIKASPKPSAERTNDAQNRTAATCNVTRQEYAVNKIGAGAARRHYNGARELVAHPFSGLSHEQSQSLRHTRDPRRWTRPGAGVLRRRYLERTAAAVGRRLPAEGVGLRGFALAPHRADRRRGNGCGTAPARHQQLRRRLQQHRYSRRDGAGHCGGKYTGRAHRRHCGHGVCVTISAGRRIVESEKYAV